jgi:hypothetical protein
MELELIRTRSRYIGKILQSAVELFVLILTVLAVVTYVLEASRRGAVVLLPALIAPALLLMCSFFIVRHRWAAGRLRKHGDRG